ncbi:hypothetical protein Y032_0279g1207 [Ancylostoma ceylanicum]|uniref:Uncharacterized protein n=1 Tax=Ancylostoma ceylanicum TaxID=53326 RepID=A0A016S850_9BILA|nr:hypothetical protein Y032_0279g1207 [Ancylostoma ceylanicum]
MLANDSNRNNIKTYETTLISGERANEPCGRCQATDAAAPLAPVVDQRNQETERASGGVVEEREIENIRV